MSKYRKKTTVSILIFIIAFFTNSVFAENSRDLNLIKKAAWQSLTKEQQVRVGRNWKSADISPIQWDQVKEKIASSKPKNPLYLVIFKTKKKYPSGRISIVMDSIDLMPVGYLPGI